MVSNEKMSIWQILCTIVTRGIDGFNVLFPLGMYDFILLKINMFLFFCKMLYLVKFFLGGGGGGIWG